MQRMIGREGGAELELGDDLGVDRLSERHALVPTFEAARHAAHQNDRALRRLEQLRGLAHQLRVSRRDGQGLIALDVDRRQLIGELVLLHLGVEIDVDRAHRRGVAHPIRAQD